MDIHECMKCGYYLTHFDNVIVCARHEDTGDIQNLLVTVKRNEDECPDCLLLSKRKNDAG